MITQNQNFEPRGTGIGIFKDLYLLNEILFF